MRDALARNLDSGEELGASLVLDLDGDAPVARYWPEFAARARAVSWPETAKYGPELATIMIDARNVSM